MMKFFTDTRGQLLVEALIALALAAILLPALFAGFFASKQGKAQQEQRIEAVALLKETEEVVRSVREKGWSLFSSNGTFHPAISGSSWSFSGGSESINGLTRSLTISDVFRDTNGVVVTSGGTLDPSTKRANIVISWNQPYASSVNSTMYVTRYLNNSISTQTLVEDFNAGVKNNTVVTNTSGGEVSLGAGGGGGDWCNPNLSITTVDLSRQGVPTAISAYTGNIVTGTGGNASGPTFVNVKVLGNTPPLATITGQYNNAKANSVFTENNYGYVATTNNGEEIQILDLAQYSDPPTNSIFTKVGYFNAPGNGQGDSVYVVNNTGYMSDGNKFYTFDMSSHTGSRPHLNTGTSWSLSGTGKKVIIIGNYAYVATSSTTTQFQIINVSNPSNPTIVASGQTGNGQVGIDLSVNSTGTRVYLVTTYTSGQPDFFIFDTSIKSGTLSPIGAGFNTSGMNPKGVAVATGNRAIIVGTGGSQQYQVLNIASELSPALCAGLPITNGANAVSAVLQPDGYAYSYIATGDANAELKLILGGSGGEYATSGNFISNFFDAGTVVAFNRFIPTFVQPDQTSLQFQVAVAEAVNNSCSESTYTFVGPDGSSSTYFTDSGEIPLIANSFYTNPGRCFKYKAFFSTNDFTASAILNDVSINYSP